MIVMAMEDAVILRKADSVVTMEQPGLLKKLRGVFSKGPIKSIEG